MKLEEIKKAVNEGHKVCWKHSLYTVIKDEDDYYMIAWNEGARDANYTGLTHKDGVTMNGEEKDFYIEAK